MVTDALPKLFVNFFSFSLGFDSDFDISMVLTLCIKINYVTAIGYRGASKFFTHNTRKSKQDCKVIFVLIELAVLSTARKMKTRKFESVSKLLLRSGAIP